MLFSHERRRWPRVLGRNRVSLVVVSAPDNPMLEGRRYCCLTEDVSVGGVRFRLHSHVPLSSVLNMDIQMENSADGSFVHMGRVAWEQEFEEEGVVARWLGVEILTTFGGEARKRRWHEVIATLQQAAPSFPT